VRKKEKKEESGGFGRIWGWHGRALRHGVTVPHRCRCCTAFCLCPSLFFADIEMKHGRAIPHGVTVPMCCPLPFNSFAVFFCFHSGFFSLSLFFLKESNEKLGLPPKKRLFKVLSLTVGIV